MSARSQSHGRSTAEPGTEPASTGPSLPLLASRPASALTSARLSFPGVRMGSQPAAPSPVRVKCCPALHLVPPAILLSPEERLLLAASKQHLGMSAGTAPEEAGVGACPRRLPRWAPAVCPPLGRGRAGTPARTQVSFAELVLSPASAPTGVPGATCSQVPSRAWSASDRRLGLEAGGKGIRARSGELELLQNGTRRCRGAGGPLPAGWICHEAQTSLAGTHPSGDTRCAGSKLQKPPPPAHTLPVRAPSSLGPPP